VSGNATTSLSQQGSHEPKPFSIEWFSANWLARPTVPVRRVALIAFIAVQVGVNPRTVTTFVLLSGFVRSRPIALGIPPQSREGVRESGWRLGRGEGLAKVVQGHFGFRFRRVTAHS
jgi:hypothetical protein